MAAKVNKVVEVQLPKWNETDEGYLNEAEYSVDWSGVDVAALGGTTRGTMTFAELVEAKTELDRITKAVEAASEKIKEQLLVASYSITAEDGVDVSDITGIEGSKFVRRSGTSPSKLDAQKLVQKGVSLAIIDECTTPGKSYDYIQVVVPKQKGGQ